ncbi:MCE family protein [Nocardia gipuzkoensis]|uniref:MlaD family protein n=1 Tax=Nocardia gipuzkoensis TaxID=2749991 RepID=UPI001E40AAAB|nr:MCE family protein [Nocardia gipuzkoensis]UGT71298.1 MCE family protein [Nocardia gipuzkoensis]
MKVRSLVMRMVLFAGAMVLLLIGVFQVIDRPVTGDTDTYTAEFADANGLRTGDDVRLYGVRVGKVGEIRLAGARAAVRFTVRSAYPLFDNSTFAIRYQNLSGQRYLDIQHAHDPSRRRDPSQRIGTEHTIPSFDITKVFNGLEPVLAQLTPADLNQFSTSMLAVIEGSGSGLGPALSAIDTLSNYVTDRQTVITTLVRNLGQVAQQLGGKSGNTVQLLRQLTAIFVNMTQRIGGLVDFSQQIPPVLRPTDRLLASLGLTPSPNPDIDQLLRRAFPDSDRTVETLSRLPAVLQSLSALIPSNVPGLQPGCAHGAAQPPQPLQLLIGGQRISLCNN